MIPLLEEVDEQCDDIRYSDAAPDDKIAALRRVQSDAIELLRSINSNIQEIARERDR